MHCTSSPKWNVAEDHFQNPAREAFHLQVEYNKDTADRIPWTLVKAAKFIRSACNVTFFAHPVSEVTDVQHNKLKLMRKLWTKYPFVSLKGEHESPLPQPPPPPPTIVAPRTKETRRLHTLEYFVYLMGIYNVYHFLDM